MTRIALVISTPSLLRRLRDVFDVSARADWQVLDVSREAWESGEACAPIAAVDVCILEAAAFSDVPARRQSSCRLVALVDGENDPFWQSPLRQQVAGVTSRDDTNEELVKAVHEVLDGRGWISPELALRVLRENVAPFQKLRLARPLDEPLTQREQEVGLLVAEGLSNDEIAFTLCIGTSTVKFHVSNILRKLSCRDRAHLAAVLHQTSSGLFTHTQPEHAKESRSASGPASPRKLSHPPAA